MSSPSTQKVQEITGHLCRYLQLQRMVAQRRAHLLFGETAAGDVVLKTQEAKIVQADLTKIESFLARQWEGIAPQLLSVNTREVTIDRDPTHGCWGSRVHASWAKTQSFVLRPTGVKLLFNALVQSAGLKAAQELKEAESAATVLRNILAAASDTKDFTRERTSNRFGLGHVRTLREYQTFCGVTFAGPGRQISQPAKNGGLSTDKGMFRLPKESVTSAGLAAALAALAANN